MRTPGQQVNCVGVTNKQNCEAMKDRKLKKKVREQKLKDGEEKKLFEKSTKRV